MIKSDKGKKVFGAIVILAIIVSVFGGVVSAVDLSREGVTQSVTDAEIETAVGNLSSDDQNASIGCLANTRLVVPFFSQRDPSWKNDLMGSSGQTIGQIGCAMTCTAMLLKYYGVNTDPGVLNAWLSTHGGYTSSGAIYWAKPAEYSNGKMHFDSMGGSISDNDNWGVLNDELSNGYPVIVQVDAYPSTPALDSHWVLVTGRAGSQYYINDPYDLSYSSKLLSHFYDSTYDNTFFGWRVYHGSSIVPPPSPPTITSPGTSSEPGEEINTLTQTFRWNSVSNADSYGLYISKYPYGSGNIIFEQEGITGTSLNLPGGYLQDGVKYRWNMKAFNGAGESGYSSRLYFWVNILQPPSAPTLTSPGTSSEPGEEINTLTQTFRWNSVSNADSYGLYISKYPYGSGSIIFEQEGITGTSLNLPGGYLQDGVKYRWNMKAFNGAGESGYSSRLYFWVNILQPPSAPTLTSPGTSSEPGEEINTLTQTFRWNSVSNADSYGLYISKYPYGSGSIIFEQEGITGTSLNLPGGYLQDGVKYRWNMKAFNGAGESGYSSRLYFWVNILQPPSAPTLISPGTSSEPGEEINTLTQTFRWNSVSNADSYGLYISKYPYGSGSIIFEQEGITGTSLNLPGGYLQDGVKYRWNMKAFNGAGESGYSSKLYFWVNILQPPSAPTLDSPGTSSEPGEEINTLTQTFRWNSVSNADSYGLYISQYPYGSGNIIFEQEGITGTSLNLPGGYLQDGVKYRWNMKAFNSVGESSYSGHLYFKVNLKEKIDGIDVSHYQGAIDWPTVYGSGYRFAFAKATGGDDDPPQIIDEQFETNMNEGHNAGVLMGAYHYAYPQYNDAVAEAQFFVSVAGKYLKGGYLRPALDLEEGAALGKEALSNWVHEWMNTVKSETGIEPIIYVNSNYANNYLDSSITQYNLWIAHWRCDTGTPPNTGIWTDWDFWQYYSPDYCGVNSVPGISGGVDLDIFNGDMDRLYTFVIEDCCGNMGVNPTSWSTTMNCGESDNEIVTVSATGGIVKGVTASKISGPTWLSVSPANLGDIASGSSKTFTMTAAPPAGTSGDFPYTVRVSNTCGTPSTRDVTGTITVRCPELSYSPGSHDFGDKCEGVTDSTTFEIWNSGTGTLTYSLSETCSWADVNPASGSSTGEHNSITVDIDTTGLSEGPHTCDISISSNGGGGTFDFGVNIICEPVLCTDPDPPSNDFGSLPEGQTRDWTFDITNSGAGTLTWSVSDNKDWITVTPTSGSTTTETDTVTVTIDTTGLGGITYNGTITVNSNDGTKQGTITVYVPEKEPDIWIDPTFLDLTLPTNTIQDYTMRIGNDGEAPLTYVISDTNTLTATATSAQFELSLETAVVALVKPHVHTAKLKPPASITYPISWIPHEISYDDGTAEDAYAWTLAGGRWAVRFTPLSYPVDLDIARIGLWENWPDVDHETFAVEVYDDDGAGGSPGTLLGTVTTTATAWGWHDVDLSGLGITVTSGDFYIAYKQLTDFPNCEGLCIDETDPQGRSWDNYDGEEWTNDPSENPGNWMIRCVVDRPEGSSWLDEIPKSGSVPPGGYDEITVTIDTTGLPEGDYSANIVIANNDPDEDPTIVPVDLTVTGLKVDLEITAKWLCWPDNCTICYNVTNIGDGTAPACHNTTLYVDGVEVAHDHVPVDLAPGESYTGYFDGYTWTYTPPSDNITVCADNNETLDELDEDNNCLTNIWMCGDVNCDGKVTMSDVRKVFNRYLDPNYPLDLPWAADVNGDGKVTMSDVRKVFNRYLDPGYGLNCCCEGVG